MSAASIVRCDLLLTCDKGHQPRLRVSSEPMRLLQITAAALMLPVLLAAQGGATQQPSAQTVCDKLSAELATQTAAYRAASAKITSTEEYKQARKARDNQALRELRSNLQRPDAAGLGRAAFDAAKDYQGDDALMLLTWAAINSRDTEIVKGVVAQVQASHMKSPALVGLLEKASLLQRPLGAEQADAFLTQVIAESPVDLAKAWALYWQSMALSRSRDREKNADKAEQLMAQAETLCGDHWLGDKIRGPKFAQEKLQVGLVAPNIQGEDMDGVKFALADYRGKVVVLDFWGFW